MQERNRESRMRTARSAEVILDLSEISFVDQCLLGISVHFLVLCKKCVNIGNNVFQG